MCSIGRGWCRCARRWIFDSVDLERKLDAEANLSGQPRSQLIREAIAELIARRERERVVAEVAAAARVLVSDSGAREEARQIGEDFLQAENDAIDAAEGRQPGEPWPEELGERWWKRCGGATSGSPA